MALDPHGLRFDLIPRHSMNEVARAWTVGADKHGDEDWKVRETRESCLAAMKRHAEKWENGEKYDKEDGQHHLAAVIVRAMMLMEMEVS